MRLLPLAALTSLALVLGAFTASAQDQPQTRVMTITTFSLPAGQERTDFWEVVDKYVVPSDKENPYILSERMGTHYYGANEPNVWIIQEYEDLAAITKAEEWGESYTNKHYPEGSAERKEMDDAFAQKFLPRFLTHTDNILSLNMERVK